MMRLFFLFIILLGAANLYMLQIPLASKKDNIVVIIVKDRVSLFKQTIRALDNQSVPFDLIVIYVDYDASTDLLEYLKSLKLKTQFEVRYVPSHDKWMYDSNFRNGKLRTIWWWLMNNAWSTIKPEYLCYFEDDIYPHPDFFKWVLTHRSSSDKYWGLLGTSNAMYTPLCLSRKEWNHLIRFYDQYCLSPSMAWDMVLFRLHHHGPLPHKRLVASELVALHMGRTNEELHKLLAKNISLVRAIPQEPLYAGKREPKEFINFDKENIEYLRHVVKRCYKDAVVFDDNYMVIQNKDVVGNDLMFLKGTVEECKKVCLKKPGCSGFVFHFGCWFKSSVETKVSKKDRLLYIK